MPDALEHDLERYFGALAERVENAVVDEAGPDSHPRGRGRWLAMAAACLVLVVGAAALTFWPTDDDVAPGPVLTDTSVTPTPTTGETDQDPAPATEGALDETFWRDATGDTELWGPYEAVWTLTDFIAIPTGGRRHSGDALVPLRIRPQTMDVEPTAAPPLGPRAHPTVVWTGRRDLLVIGGTPSGASREPIGAAYDVMQDTWTPIDAPPEVAWGAPGTFDEGVWNGSEVVFWEEGQAFDPEEDAWRPIATSPLAHRGDPASVAIGSDVLVWGGCEPTGPDCDHDPDTWRADGAIWSAETGEWSAVPDGPLDPAPGAIAVADASGVTVVGLNMLDDGGDRNLVARYEPGLGWIDLPDPPAAPWIGSDLTLVGCSVVLSGWAYDAVQYVALHPGADEWVALPSAGASADHSLVDGSGHLLVIRGRQASGPSQDQVLAISEPWLPVEPESIDVEIRVDMSEGVPFAEYTKPELPPGSVYVSLWLDGRLRARSSAIGSTAGSNLAGLLDGGPIEARLVVEDVDMYPIAATDPVQLTLP